MCAICLVAIAIVAYFMYTKVTNQNTEMLKLSKRCEAIEMLFARPPPPDDLQAMYRPRYGGQYGGQYGGHHNTGRVDQPAQHREHEGGYERPQPRSPPCESAMCDLNPLHIDTNEDELNHIVNAELNKVIEEDTKKKTSKCSSSK